MTALFSADDYAGAARALMPRGPVWPDDPDSIQGKLLAALAQALWRSDGAAQQLLDDAFPGTTEGLLEEWQDTLGLPDAALGDPGSDDARRSQIVARLVGAGGQSRARFISFAASLGFTITIGNYEPFRAGRARAGQHVQSGAWTDLWSIHVTANAGGLDPSILKAALDEIKPATSYTILV